MKVSTALPVPIERAWEWLSNPTNDPTWCGPVASTTLASGDAGAVGAVYDFVEEFRGSPSEGTIEIVELDPPTRMVTRVRTKERDYQVRYDLAPAGGGCTLTQTSETSFRGLPSPVARMVTPLVRAQVKRQFKELGRILAEQ